MVYTVVDFGGIVGGGSHGGFGRNKNPEFLYCHPYNLEETKFSYLICMNNQ